MNTVFFKKNIKAMCSLLQAKGHGCEVFAVGTYASHENIIQARTLELWSAKIKSKLLYLNVLIVFVDANFDICA